jgi:glycosyltransferase involved in cell wall biosynthesis
LSVRPLIVDLGRDDRGGQHQALLVLQGLRERGHAPELIAVRDSLLARRAKESGAPVHEVGADWRRISAAARIRRLVRARRVDLVHANEPHALTSAWVARAHAAVPIVASRRIALPLSRDIISIARYRAAARIVAVSHFVEQSVIQSGMPRDRVSVIYDGVRIPAELSQARRQSAREELGIAPESLCIANVAAFVPEKGHALLLDAFAALRPRFPNACLLLRGEGPESSSLQRSARQLQVDAFVKFLPAATKIEDLFAAAKIFAFPSHEEPLGSALLAAMAHGLPCVAIAAGGVPEIVDDGKTGLLVKDCDPEAFATALARLLDEPYEAVRLGEAARAAIRARFSADRMVEETARLYERVVTGDQ